MTWSRITKNNLYNIFLSEVGPRAGKANDE